MMDAFRNAKNSWIIRILFILLALSFVGWGVGDVITSGFGPGSAIKVGDTDVGAQEVNAEFKREVDRLQPLFGGKLTGEEARKLGLMDKVVETIVQRSLIDEAGRRLGLVADDAQVIAAISSNPAFRNQFGQFDRERLRQAIARAGLSENAFMAMERSDLVRSQMASSLGGAVAAPSALVDPLVRWREERRVAEAVEIRDDSFPLPPAPDNSTLEQFYKDNASRFMAPEFRSLTALLLRPEDIAAEIRVDEAELAEAYKAHAADFNTPETRAVTQVVATDQAGADKAEALVRQGKDLAAIAKELNLPAIDLGNVQKAHLPPELAEAAFALSAGATGGPVKTALGWHVLKVTKVDPARTRPLAEVKGELMQTLKHDKAVEALTDIANKLEDTLGGGATLEEAAQKLALKVVKVPAVDAQGKGPDGKPAAALPKAESFLDVAFHTDQGQESVLTEIESGGYFIVRVDQVVAPAPRPLADVRAQVVAAWQAQQRNIAAGKKAQQVADQLKAGESLAKVAQANGLKPVATKPFTREGAEAEPLPAPVVAELFKAQPGQVASGAGTAGWVVARLAKVVPFDGAAGSAEAKDARARLSQAVAGDLVDQYLAALNAEIGVKVDRKQLVRDE